MENSKKKEQKIKMNKKRKQFVFNSNDSFVKRIKMKAI